VYLGGGSAARPVLQTRLAGGNPPDTRQTHSGHELLGHYVQAGYCVPLTVLYQSEGWDRVVPQGLLDEVSKGGEVYAVLVGIHRGNVLWYNKKLLKKHGIKVGDTFSFEQFFSAAQRLKAAGLVPLAMGDAGLWATAELFENTLLGVLGPQGWQELFGGEMAFDDPRRPVNKIATDRMGSVANPPLFPSPPYSLACRIPRGRGPEESRPARPFQSTLRVTTRMATRLDALRDQD